MIAHRLPRQKNEVNSVLLPAQIRRTLGDQRDFKEMSFMVRTVTVDDGEIKMKFSQSSMSAGG